jgi:hypothetical protein
MKGNAIQVRAFLFEKLEHLGAIKWSNSSARNSAYLKFKDTRLGSVRISNHEGRHEYNFTYEVRLIENYTDDKILQEIIDSVELKSKSLRGFNPKTYLVYDGGEYKECVDEGHFRDFINKKCTFYDYFYSEAGIREVFSDAIEKHLKDKYLESLAFWKNKQ